MDNFLNDVIFLDKLDKLTNRKIHLRLTLLNFLEEPIREIAGMASGNGTININGASDTRRTISFSLLAYSEKNNLTDIDNLISMNKKFKVRVGIENLLAEYQHYGDIIWFDLGVYVISKASLSYSTSACNISISGKDKMCMLDGSVGGTLPNTVVFHEIYEETEQGDYIISYPSIYRIIFEAVNHYGQEPADNIIINDLEETTKKLVKYAGSSPLWIKDDDSNSSVNIIISDKKQEGYTKYRYGEDVGYIQTTFSYPSELILSAGETVVSLLKKIVEILGNYEFFYNLDGKFVFQRIPTYQDVSYSPIQNRGTETYIRNFTDTKYAYSLKDEETLISVNNNPNYDNIKNDFIVWGQKPIINSNNTKPICYRIAIDDKPELFWCKKYMWEVRSGTIENKGKLLRYDYTTKLESEEYTVNTTIQQNGEIWWLIAVPLEDWREELYRRALIGQLSGTPNSAYDSELLTFWRENVYPIDKYYEYKSDTEMITNPFVEQNGEIENKYWNPAFNGKGDYSDILYWLDFLETSGDLGKYSVSNIGRRTKVVNSQDVRSLYNKEVPDIIFIENDQEIENIAKTVNKMKAEGQKYCFLPEEQFELLLTSATGASAYDTIRELLYQHLIYNTTIALTCIPKYYLDTNQLIYIQNEKSGIIGDYVIQSISMPIGYSGTMTINANQALTRI